MALAARVIPLVLDREIFEPDSLPHVTARRGYPLTLRCTLKADGTAISGWKTGLDTLRAELHHAQAPASAALAVVELDSAAISAAAADSFDLVFSAEQMTQDLDRKPSDDFWLAVTGELEGGTPVDLGEAIVTISERNISAATGPAPEVATLYATTTALAAAVAALQAEIDAIEIGSSGLTASDDGMFYEVADGGRIPRIAGS